MLIISKVTLLFKSLHFNPVVLTKETKTFDIQTGKNKQKPHTHRNKNRKKCQREESERKMVNAENENGTRKSERKADKEQDDTTKGVKSGREGCEKRSHWGLEMH